VNVNARERETERLEAFSDGVFAFVITLLVLNHYAVILAKQLFSKKTSQESRVKKRLSVHCYTCTFEQFNRDDSLTILNGFRMCRAAWTRNQLILGLNVGVEPIQT
jgi:hypothetical protein